MSTTKYPVEIITLKYSSADLTRVHISLVLFRAFTQGNLQSINSCA